MRLIDPDRKQGPRRTKIVATLGPATTSPRAVRSLLEAGVDVVRLNFSHGSAEEHRRRCQAVRAAARRLGRTVAVLADLSGPKIRTGRFRGGQIDLGDGERVTVTTRAVLGGPGLIPCSYRRLGRDLRPGARIFLDDGAIEIEVEAIEGPDLRCRVRRGGRLSDRKGINLPGSSLSLPALTAKDRRDARAAVAMGVDYLALSFVRRGADVAQLRRWLRGAGADLPIVAKIEKPEALEHIEEVIEASDAILVARGDLGVELRPEQVPVVQRELVRRAIERNRPVIVATQMLESMVERSRPTRAEVNDVAGAAFAGADAVMLSAETATGLHPVEAVRTMDRILREVEGYLQAQGSFLPGALPVSGGEAARLHDAVGRAASLLAHDLAVGLIFVPSRTGASIRAVSADRPLAPVVGASADEAIRRRMALYWGVSPLRLDARPGASLEAAGRRAALRLGLARKGDRLLVVRGFDPDPARSAPTLTVILV